MQRGALFELHHCDNTPAQREALIAQVKLEMEEVTAEMKAAQPGAMQRYREHSNDQERLYMCACCGERNKEATGECTRLCGLWILLLLLKHVRRCADCVIFCLRGRCTPQLLHILPLCGFRW